MVLVHSEVVIKGGEVMIYVIGCGEDCDWDIIGYTTNEEEAQRIVAEKNTNSEGFDFWYMNLEKISHEQIEKPKILQKATYYHKNGVLYCSEKSNLTYKECSEVTVSMNPHDLYRVDKTFPLGTSREKMLKVCRDIVAEYKARKQGL